MIQKGWKKYTNYLKNNIQNDPLQTHLNLSDMKNKEKKGASKIIQSRRLMLEYIDEHPDFPDFIKPEFKSEAVNIFNRIMAMAGVVELTFRRTYAHYDEIDPKTGKGKGKNEKPNP